MNDQIKDGGSAFPILISDGGRWVRTEFGGMTLRDYFAAKAMQGWLSTFSAADSHPCRDGANPEWAKNFSIQAYRMADAMLRAREAQL